MIPMPRARNEQTERAIQSAAWKLFFEKGFAATSYSDLAACSGISRPLVQRYVPHKNLLVQQCVQEIRTAAVRACDEAYPDTVHPLARLYLRGQVNIATYFACNGIRRFMVDVFSSRELTQQTIVEGFQWTVSETLPDRPELVGAAEPDVMIMAMGGLYELVYIYLVRGAKPDVSACTLPTVMTFSREFGIELPAEGLEAYTIAPDELDRLARRSVELVAW